MQLPARWDADTAVEELYAAHYRRLVRLSVLLVRDLETAEEVVQDAFVAMHGRWRTLKDPEKGLAYLRQTVVNRSRSVLRHRGVEARYVVPAVRHLHGADEAALVSERRAAVLDALRKNGIDAAHGAAVANPQTPVTGEEEKGEPLDRLTKLMQLRAANLITDEELQQYRKRILDEV
jgi:DNA-directed RNA polymerase specialized sigma24 family protein